jgi:hypothetical protein
VDAGGVAVSVGMLAYGAAFFGAAEWYVRDDARMQRRAQQRARALPSRIWYWTSGIWTGTPAPVTEQEKTDYWIRHERRLVKWWFRPFAVFYFALCFAGVVAAIRAASAKR